ncbi:hypothetical protein QQ008_03285 [Fulvivirgaceae bacterium BMA10]|uniref:Uncharacterized protein n=1 Tax=Splendidivirga corallicola TaxID=3051826 RepID=A0ABT8KI22_9BACT|nr:hypothetical protein [Fulvivirgaceae bacterium BMA10]
MQEFKKLVLFISSIIAMGLLSLIMTIAYIFEWNQFGDLLLAVGSAISIAFVALVLWLSSTRLKEQ